MISIVYPTYNRADLFAATLDTWRCQTGRTHIPYELLVLDDGSTDHLRDLVRYESREIPEPFRLPLRYLRVDVMRGAIPPPGPRKNPAAALNVGIKQAAGEWVALTSPEVKHLSPDNLSALYAATRVPPADVALVVNVYDRTWKDTEFAGWIGGGPRSRPLHFFTVYPRQALIDLGGFEELFMRGRGYEDNDLVDRWTAAGGRYHVLGMEVACEHQPHPRAEPGPDDAVNAQIYQELRAAGVVVANRGREWGSAALVVEQW